MATEPPRFSRRLITPSYLRDFIELVALFIQLLLGLYWWDISDGLQQSTIVEPVDPFQGFPLDRICSFPWPQPVNDFRLEQADDRLRQRVVLAVTYTANRGFDPGFSLAFDIADRHILAAPVAVMDQIAPWTPLMKRLFQCIQYELGPWRARHPPDDDALHLLAQSGISLGAIRGTSRIAGKGRIPIKSGGGGRSAEPGRSARPHTRPGDRR